MNSLMKPMVRALSAVALTMSVMPAKAETIQDLEAREVQVREMVKEEE